MNHRELVGEPRAIEWLRQILRDDSPELRTIVSDFVSELARSSNTLGARGLPNQAMTRVARDWIVSASTGAGVSATDNNRASTDFASALPADLALPPLLVAISHAKGRLMRLLLAASVTRDAALALTTFDALESGFECESARLVSSRIAEPSNGDDVETRVAKLVQILASISHELRNPLSTIETSAYLVSQRLSAQNDASIGKHLEKIRSHVRFASQMVNTLLDLARQRPPKRTQVALRALLESAIEARPSHPNVAVKLELPPDLSIFVDADQLRMIIENLLSNANEACANSGNRHVTIVARVSGDDIDISVIDDGPGVTEEIRSRIFDVAFTTKQSGHGLGLPLCRRLAENHGGTLTLDSYPRGSAFRLHIPGAVRNDAERSG